MVRKSVLFGLLVLVLGLAACKKDGEKPEENNNVVRIDAKAFETWKYFSFSERKEVEVSDPTKDRGWDIGFHRGDIRTNSALSGPGQGGAYMTASEELADVKSIPAADAFTVDDKPAPITVLLDMDAGKKKDELQPVNYAMTTCEWKVVKDEEGHWMVSSKMVNGKQVYEKLEKPTQGIVKRDVSQMPPRYTVNPKVYIVRCADGKFAKFKVLDFFDEKNRAGVVQFQYEYPME